MRTIDLLGGTEIVSSGECWEMLATQSIGRIAFTYGGEVDIFPVNYGLDDEGIIFRTNAGRKIAAIDGGELAFEVDAVDPETRSGWSVVIHGTARDITRFDAPLRRLAVSPWTGSKDFLVRISPRTVTGRRVFPQLSSP
jgi:nitroimidazol reductase NimA-like FMN-containing flavoprotein (pyridoxamine 5'-phosphate oxidase superfamily)